MREAASPAGSVHDAREVMAVQLAQANVLVGRRFDEPVAFEALQAADQAGASCHPDHRSSSRIQTAKSLTAETGQVIVIAVAPRRS